MPNKIRELVARAIENNNGYSSNWRSYALEWTVGVHESVPDFDILFARHAEIMEMHIGGTGWEFDEGLLQKLREDWDDERTQDREWQWAVNDMALSFQGAEAYNTMRPEIAHRYGFPVKRFPNKYVRRTAQDMAYYPPKFEGVRNTRYYPEWKLVDPWALPSFEAEFSFEGRGGKHLVVESFEGRNLKMGSEYLADEIRNDDNGIYSNEWCRALLAMIHEWDLCFTPAAVKSEFRYQIEFRFAQRLEEVHDATAKLREEAAERQFWAERDVMTKEA